MSHAKELDDRIEWVLRNRPHLVVRGEASQREWSRLAKHRDGKPFGITQVNQIRLRIKNWLENPKGGPEPSWEIETLEALADAAKVSRTWFVQGIGAPDTVSVDANERYPVLTLVREAAKNDGFDAGFVDAFITDLDKDDQPSFGELWDLLSSAYARHQRKTRSLGDPGADLDDRPPRHTTRKKR